MKEYNKLVVEMSNEYLKKNKWKFFFEKVLKYLPIFNFFVAISALIVSIIALFK